jgi:hypothetical protein
MWRQVVTRQECSFLRKRGMDDRERFGATSRKMMK